MNELGHWCDFCQMYHSSRTCYHPGGQEFKRLRAELDRLRERVAKHVTARNFHEIYERKALIFGYETRDETREFDPKSPNGKLMIVVCRDIRRAVFGDDG